MIISTTKNNNNKNNSNNNNNINNNDNEMINDNVLWKHFMEKARNDCLKDKSFSLCSLYLPIMTRGGVRQKVTMKNWTLYV